MVEKRLKSWLSFGERTDDNDLFEMAYETSEPTMEQLEAIERNGENLVAPLSLIEKQYEREIRSTAKNAVLQKKEQPDGTVRVVKFYGEKTIEEPVKPSRFKIKMFILSRLKELHQEKRWLETHIKPSAWKSVFNEIQEKQKRLDFINKNWNNLG